MAKRISTFVCMCTLSIIGLFTFVFAYNKPKEPDNNVDNTIIESTTETEQVYSATPELVKIGNVWYYVTSRTPSSTTTTTTESTTRMTARTTYIPAPTPVRVTTPKSTTTTTDTTTTKRVTTTKKKTATTTTTTTTTAKSLAQPEVYVVYKPSTHYIHKSTCKWFDKTCVHIENTNGLECRRCSQCKPDMEIVKTYTPPVTHTESSTKSSFKYNHDGVTDAEIILLQKLVQNEYGADWVSTYDKACIVASVMNQVKDKRFPNTVTKCIYKSCVPYGFNPNKKRTITDSVKKAVQYYFENRYTVFKPWTANSWYGDGRRNHFSRA